MDNEAKNTHPSLFHKGANSENTTHSTLSPLPSLQVFVVWNTLDLLGTLSPALLYLK